jgi:hypothetical protein|tara:strand:+ start:148 stop:573 length:426 start_codon:yes stop_codon:yes gene_type:complete
MRIRLERTEKRTISELVFALCQRFPDRSLDLMQLCNGASAGITLEMTPTKEWHTRSQQNYYRKWSREFSVWCGMTPDEMHEELLCRCYGSEEIETKMGMRRRPLQRSSEASKLNFSELIDTLVNTAGEMGFAVPIGEDIYD